MLSLLLALGRYAHVYEFLAAVPLVGQLRGPARFTFFPHVATAIVVALAFSDLLRVGGSARDIAGRAGCWIWAAPAASVAVAVFALGFSKLPAVPGDLGRSIAGADLVLLGPALSLLCAALWWSAPPQTLDSYTAEALQVPDPEAGRVATGFSIAVAANKNGDVVFPSSTRFTLRGGRLVWGYAGLMPDRALQPLAPRTLDVTATAYVLQQGRFEPRSPVLSRFRLMSEASIVYDLPAQMQRLNPARTALVSRPIDIEPGPQGSVRIERDRPGDIRLSVNAPTRQLLVASESFHPGWQIEIDGNAAPVLRVYGDFMGAVVESGKHGVALGFRLRSFSTGRAFSAIGLLVLTAAAYSWLASDNPIARVAAHPVQPSS